MKLGMLILSLRRKSRDRNKIQKMLEHSFGAWEHLERLTMSAEPIRTMQHLSVLAEEIKFV